MKIKPILPFRAVVTGSPYPKDITTDDEFAPDSEEAQIALNLGCLSEKDAATVKAAAEKAAAEKAAAEKAAAEKAAAEKAPAENKAKGAAPENKADGTKD